MGKSAATVWINAFAQIGSSRAVLTPMKFRSRRQAETVRQLGSLLMNSAWMPLRCMMSMSSDRLMLDSSMPVESITNNATAPITTVA